MDLGFDGFESMQMDRSSWVYWFKIEAHGGLVSESKGLSWAPPREPFVPKPLGPRGFMDPNRDMGKAFADAGTDAGDGSSQGDQAPPYPLTIWGTPNDWTVVAESLTPEQRRVLFATATAAGRGRSPTGGGPSGGQGRLPTGGGPSGGHGEAVPTGAGQGQMTTSPLQMVPFSAAADRAPSGSHGTFGGSSGGQGEAVRTGAGQGQNTTAPLQDAPPPPPPPTAVVHPPCQRYLLYQPPAGTPVLLGRIPGDAPVQPFVCPFIMETSPFGECGELILSDTLPFARLEEPDVDPRGKRQRT